MMKRQYVTASGEVHGLINSVGNSVQGQGNLSHMAPADKEKAEKLKKEEQKIVKARYINYRGPQERLDKMYMRWAGEPIEKYHFIPNEVYEVPMGLVKEINESPGLVKRSEVLDANGTPTVRDGASIKTHEFVPVSF